MREFDNIKIQDICGVIMSEPVFWYQKAIDAWGQWKNMPITNEELHKLLSMRYDDFCDSHDPAIMEVRKKLFTAVSYFDAKSKDKNRYNEYEDKRTIARAGIRQDDWTTRLLKYKKNSTDLTPGIRNLINYLDDPRANFPIISELHKKKIYHYFIGENTAPYSTAQFNSAMHNYFQGKIECVNADNYTAAAARLIYSLRTEWDEKPSEVIKGLFAHERKDLWKQNLQNKIGDGKACVWWHTLPPTRYKKEIMDQLSSIIDNGGNFDLYYIKNKKAQYKARVIDFATAENYDEKYGEWKDQNPHDIEENFSGYYDGNKHAAIVFLIDKFCEKKNKSTLAILLDTKI